MRLPRSGFIPILFRQGPAQSEPEAELDVHVVRRGFRRLKAADSKLSGRYWVKQDQAMAWGSRRAMRILTSGKIRWIAGRPVGLEKLLSRRRRADGLLQVPLALQERTDFR